LGSAVPISHILNWSKEKTAKHNTEAFFSFGKNSSTSSVGNNQARSWSLDKEKKFVPAVTRLKRV
jgi:hypothetical protein